MLGTCAVAGPAAGATAPSCCGSASSPPSWRSASSGAARAAVLQAVSRSRTRRTRSSPACRCCKDRGQAQVFKRGRRCRRCPRCGPRCWIACARAACCVSAISRTACHTRSSTRAGDLVGFDVEMAHQLARDLGVGLELVPDRTLHDRPRGCRDVRPRDVGRGRRRGSRDERALHDVVPRRDHGLHRPGSPAIEILDNGTRSVR